MPLLAYAMRGSSYRLREDQGSSASDLPHLGFAQDRGPAWSVQDSGIRVQDVGWQVQDAHVPA